MLTNEGEVPEIYKKRNAEFFLDSRETLRLLVNNESLDSNHEACSSKISL